jgi:aspartate aminotransferase
MLDKIFEKTLELEREGKKIIKLNVGDPDQRTSHRIIEAAFEAIEKGKTKYSASAGEKELRDTLASIHDVPVDKVVVTSGSRWAIFSVMYSLLKKGDNVVILTPHWPAYESTAKSLGAETRFLRTEVDSNWKIDVGKLEGLVDERTRLLILNNPNNPTSKVIDRDVLEDIVRFANNKRTTILSDEVYSDISFVEAKSVLDFDNHHIVVKSFSKTFAMTGWRVGYAIVERELAKKIIKLNQMTLINVPVFVQHAALKALELKEEIVDRIREEYRRRTDLVCNILSKTRMRFSRPEAPFYVFPKYDNLDSESFSSNLLDKGVAIVPGTAFGNYLEHFRIALTVPEEQLESGLRKICEELP